MSNVRVNVGHSTQAKIADMIGDQLESRFRQRTGGRDWGDMPFSLVQITGVGSAAGFYVGQEVIITSGGVPNFTSPQSRVFDSDNLGELFDISAFGTNTTRGTSGSSSYALAFPVHVDGGDTQWCFFHQSCRSCLYFNSSTKTVSFEYLAMGSTSVAGGEATASVAVSANANHYIYLADNTTLVLDSSSNTIPAGYDYAVEVGYITTDASNNLTQLQDLTQDGAGISMIARPTIIPGGLTVEIDTSVNPTLTLTGGIIVGNS